MCREATGAAIGCDPLAPNIPCVQISTKYATHSERHSRSHEGEDYEMATAALYLMRPTREIPLMVLPPLSTCH